MGGIRKTFIYFATFQSLMVHVLNKCAPSAWDDQSEIVHLSMDSEEVMSVFDEANLMAPGINGCLLTVDGVDVIYKPGDGLLRLWWTVCCAGKHFIF
jgi:hypothetical protein